MVILKKAQKNLLSFSITLAMLKFVQDLNGTGFIM